MAKSKTLTPQDIYRERKQREEREKTAYLPPGLINHGNTCFMNSVLQGLIATRLLSDLVHFYPVPPEIQRTAATPLVSRRSPQLTNGHNLAGPYEQPWVNTMPIGDMFLTVVYKAWDSQSMRRRDILSPKSILGTLGQKYDQYLDFAQQDAHEFLRILLDAMRMEEQDIIKKRQPPPPPNHHKKRRRTTITPANAHQPQSQATEPSSSSSTQPNGHVNGNINDMPEMDDLKLMSFVDMIFGGQLTSILVCQKCKHVSQTYEEFNDISLSIKAEDYFPHNKKRDRFKRMVGKLTAFPGTSSQSANPSPLFKDPLKFAAQQLRAAAPTHLVEMQRSSSVPPSPRTEASQLGGGRHDEPPTIEAPRRKSLDVVRVGEAESGGESPEIPTQVSTPAAEASDGQSDRGLQENEREREDDGALESDHSHVIVNVTGPEDKHVEFVEPKISRKETGLEGGKEKEKDASSSSGKEGKDKDKLNKSDDGWAKIGRRISLSVGLGRQKGGDKEKEKDKKDRDRKSRSMDRSGALGGPIKEVAAESEMGMQKSLSASTASTPSTTLADLGAGKKRVSSDGSAHPPWAATATATTSESPGSSLNANTAQKASKPLPPQPNPSSTSIPTISSTSSPQLQQPNLLSSPSQVASSFFPNVQRSRSPKPPKPSAAETEYLRKILADISTSATSNNPFAIFKPPILHSHSLGSTSTTAGSMSAGSAGVEKGAGATWLGMGLRNFSGLEECLRMFTAVEVLDGENMVGCRRCWKIQNGVYQASKGKQEDSDKEDQEDQDEGERITVEDDPGGKDLGVNGINIPTLPPLQIIAPSVSMSSPTGSGSVRLLTSISTPTVSFYSHADTSDTRSVSSLPTEDTSASELNLELLKEGDDSGDSPFSLSVISEASTKTNDDAVLGQPGPGGLPIPVISTTAPPDTPPAWLSSIDSNSSAAMESVGDASDTNRQSAYAGEETGVPAGSAAACPSVPAPHPRLTKALYGYDASSGSTGSLVIPHIGRPRYRKSYSDTTDNDSSGDDSDTSVGTSVSADSAASSSVPRSVSVPSVNGSKPAQPFVASSSPKSQQQPTSASAPVPQKKPSKPPKPVIMRPAYKRYLIATPPPVLVVHLKRFQQTSKMPLMSMSFSHGFKKLDDNVSFPEYLDLMPFLAPRKEDYGLGKKGKDKEKKPNAKEERCMYRLYAVVVHIGNMLGGHYIAYTALPAESPVQPPSTSLNDTGNAASTFTSGSDTSGEKEHAKVDPAQQPKPAERQWAYISDTVVRLTTLEEVLHAKAYICMYERC